MVSTNLCHSKRGYIRVSALDALHQMHAPVVETLAVFTFPPEILAVGDAFFFQQALDGDAPLAALRLNLFDLFSCKYISVCVSATKLRLTYTH